MPVYDYHCPECGKIREIVHPIAELTIVRWCKEGHIPTPMQRLLSAPMVRGDYPGYSCPITGKWIEGRKAHEENLRKHGCRVIEAGEREALDRRRKAADDALDKAIEATVEEEIHKMPAEKRDKLAAELLGGFTVDVVRGTSTE